MNKITILFINVTARFCFYSHCDVIIHNEFKIIKILELLLVNIFTAFDISIYN